MTKLTIITINYNNAAGLRKTMESVLAQTSKDFEYIVIDGASTDGSVEYLKTRNPEPEIRNAEPETHVINFQANHAIPPKPVLSASSSIQKLALCKPPVSAFEAPLTPKR